MICSDRDYLELRSNRWMVDELPAALLVVDAELDRWERDRGDRFRPGEWIPTMSGKRLFFQDPRPEEIDPFDIAYGLARIPRFTAMTLGDPLSVAEHSVRGSRVVDKQYSLHFLLHDAQEFVVNDLSTPIKKVVGESYDFLEWILTEAIAARFGIEWSSAAEAAVKAADNEMFEREAGRHAPWGHGRIQKYEAMAKIVQTPAWDWRTAYRKFKARFEELTDETIVEPFEV